MVELLASFRSLLCTCIPSLPGQSMHHATPEGKQEHHDCCRSSTARTCN